MNEELVNAAKIVLANHYAFYVKAQYYHWNVEGPNFPQYHEFLGNLYEEVGGSIDSMAEHIRALGAYAPGSFQRFIELSQISGDDNIISAPDMFLNLYNDNEKLLKML